MLQDIDLRALAEMDGPERAFVSAYLTGREGLRAVEAVKKGGWSLKRHARRPKNVPHHYAAEVAAVLQDLEQKESIGHIILMGR